MKTKGVIFNIQRFCVHDGPGIRTTVFFKGCPLRCSWCHNPEAMGHQPVLAFTPKHCAACGACVSACDGRVHAITDGRHRLERVRCRACGLCTEACPRQALELIGREVTAAEVMASVEKDREFYETSGGGVTFSGGEPFAQPGFLHALLTLARQAGVHTAVDTCGHAEWSDLKRSASLIDLFLYDIKLMQPDMHRDATGVDNARILENLRRLDELGRPIVVRRPVVPGINDGTADFVALGRFLASRRNCVRVELLPYHRLAEAKHERIGNPYKLAGTPEPNRDALRPLAESIRSAGFQEVAIGL